MKEGRWLPAVVAAAGFFVFGSAAGFGPRDSAAQQQPQASRGAVSSVTLKDIQKGVSAAAQQYAANKKALALQLKTDRRALVKGPAWKSLSQAQKNVRLNALRTGYQAKMDLLRKDYKAKIMAFARARRTLVAKSRAAAQASARPGRTRRRGRAPAPAAKGAMGAPARQPGAPGAGPMGVGRGR